ncbi:rhodanese-like domain-containing protein [Candidatus Enterococcus ikei]|uniref:Rhodanese-like domain-containing protein n=1 Tax=Candidatus Enterococcus ikei TaxID=2815326 RepID=A0ABS3GZR5_9ENTE|nr:rhodanese-like domain-containing protein [Enterococcus sp. DIV0869a]MBO0440710.1 rhodanese-like domain-containing protein [Enterococcus sp. DIV0869a]
MYKSIMIDEFEQLEKRNELAIIDVREDEEYLSGHIKGAKSLPLSTLDKTAGSLDKEQPYYIICHSGGRSQMASEYFASLGYDVTNVMGGMSAWRGEVIDGV